MVRFIGGVLLFLLVACGAETLTVTPIAAPAASPSAIVATATPELSATILPDASQSFKQVSGRAPFTVTFSAKVTGGTAPYTLSWDVNGDARADSTAAAPAPVVFKTPGVYTATVTIRDAAGQTAEATRRIVAFGEPQIPTWKYAVTAHLERRHDPYYPTLDDVAHAAKLMQDGGVQAVRMDFNWDMLNPTQDQWVYDDYDKTVAIVRQHGMGLDGILDYTSWWASSAQDSKDWRVRLYSEPLNNHDFAEYTYNVVSHFKNDVPVWEIWNEPNTSGFWKPAPNAAHYVALLQEAYLAAKYADPNATVLMAGMSGNGVEGNDDSGLASNYLEQMYVAGARGYFDAANIHPYMLPDGGITTLRDKLTATRAVMSKYGDTQVPLWVTEIGVPSDVPWWSTAPLQSQTDVADWLQQVYTHLWDLTPTIFWYELQDRDMGDDAEAHFGLLHPDFSVKPAYQMFQSLAKGE